MAVSDPAVVGINVLTTRNLLLTGNVDIATIVAGLMSRPLKRED